MSNYNDRETYRRKDDFYRDQDRCYENFRDDLAYERKRRSADYEEASRAIRSGDTLRALGHIDPDLALRYAGILGHTSSSSSSSNSTIHRVREIQIFESGYNMPVLAERQYATHFSQGSARYICTQVTLPNPFLVVDYDFDIVVRYIKADGNVLGTLSDSISVPKSQRTYTYTAGWGWKNTGMWEPETYRIEVLFDQVLVGEAEFTVQATPFADGLLKRKTMFPGLFSLNLYRGLSDGDEEDEEEA